MIVRERGAGGGGRERAENERRESVRQRRVVLTPDMLASSSGEIRFSGTTVARELRLTGESAL